MKAKVPHMTLNTTPSKIELAAYNPIQATKQNNLLKMRGTHVQVLRAQSTSAKDRCKRSNGRHEI